MAESEAALLRGRLKHSWLQNRVLNKSPADILDMRRAGPWDALERAFPICAETTIELARNLPLRFGPVAALEHNLQAVNLDPAVLAALRRDLEAATPQSLLARAAPLEAAATAIADAFQRVRVLWRDGSDEALAQAWSEALTAALRLRHELDLLPKEPIS